ncbi:DUF5994 family protein [Streptodolium elevatio]
MTMTNPSAPARLAFAPAGRNRSRIDGAWWPRSRDLAAELPSLGLAMTGLGVITRATVNPRHWDSVPRLVRVSGRPLKVGWFTDEQDEHEIMLLSYHAARWELLVVPPETDSAVAAQLMEAAASPDDLRGAGELIRAMVRPLESVVGSNGRAKPGYRQLV